MKEKKQKILDEESRVIDCRSEEGITIGLIDSIISISRILAKREFNTPSIQQALYYLRDDEDVSFLVYREGEKTLISRIVQQIRNKQIKIEL